MIIRKLLLSAVAFAAISTTSLVFAQQGKGGGGKASEAAMARLEPLALTAAQKTKVQAILAKSAADLAALPQEERRTKGGELRQASNKEIRALLTPDQQKKFDALPPMTGGKKKN
jgi:Spy/CpxP family protein refolding chaperone